jgi:hypothetical protein
MLRQLDSKILLTKSSNSYLFVYIENKQVRGCLPYARALHGTTRRSLARGSVRSGNEPRFNLNRRSMKENPPTAVNPSRPHCLAGDPPHLAPPLRRPSTSSSLPRPRCVTASCPHEPDRVDVAPPFLAGAQSADVTRR